MAAREARVAACLVVALASRLALVKMVALVAVTMALVRVVARSAAARAVAAY